MTTTLDVTGVDREALAASIIADATRTYVDTVGGAGTWAAARVALPELAALVGTVQQFVQSPGGIALTRFSASSEGLPQSMYEADPCAHAVDDLVTLIVHYLAPLSACAVEAGELTELGLDKALSQLAHIEATWGAFQPVMAGRS